MKHFNKEALFHLVSGLSTSHVTDSRDDEMLRMVRYSVFFLFFSGHRVSNLYRQSCRFRLWQQFLPPMTYAQRHGGPSQLAAERLVALLTSPSNGTSGTLAQSLHDCLFFFWPLQNSVNHLMEESQLPLPQNFSLDHKAKVQFWKCRFIFQYNLGWESATTCAQVTQMASRWKHPRFKVQDNFFCPT